MSELNAGFVGLLIRSERLKKDWSQQGLCQGICAVSYLSKIEQGKVRPSDEVLTLLLERLGVQWHTGETAEKARRLAEGLYCALCEMDAPRGEQLCKELDNNMDYVNTESMLDLCLLRGMYRKGEARDLTAFIPFMNERQRALLHLLRDEYELAYSLLPLPLTCALAGYQDYISGNYMRAQERLARAFQQAAEGCLPHLMLFCKSFLGNCCSDLEQFDAMMVHNEAALRLALALGNEEYVRDIRYNIAATQMQLGRYEEAYLHFSSIREPAVMDLHKLAICCEKLGHRKEALDALERAPNAAVRYQVLMREAAEAMCAVVRYRLEHPDYLSDQRYGELLLNCFQMLCQRLPRGYARFHLPWVEEWYLAHRQYKQIWELSQDFPGMKH